MNYHGFNKNELALTVKNLNQLLADYQVYYQNLRNFHWNVAGENFFDLHAQFEALYTDARIKIDEIAERILTLRSRPMSTLSDYLQLSNVREAKKETDDHKMVMIVLENHKVLINCMRNVIKAADCLAKTGDASRARRAVVKLTRKARRLHQVKSGVYV